MNNFSKVVILILIVLTFLFIKDKFGVQINDFINNGHNFNVKIENPFDRTVDKSVEDETVKKPVKTFDDDNKNNVQQKDTVTLYLLALDSDDNGIYRKVKRDYSDEETNKLEFAIKELLKGPSIVEKTQGVYSEIPPDTKLLKISSDGDKIIIDLNSDFQYGGGTDSLYSRTMQLIKTALVNAPNKQIYLYIDGKKVNTLGGEGLMISQPLKENSLDG